mmetsp:Transcript_8872/g.25558  ORF Transcript_8872/g.25558 Transcript_8872/m.25558 type:complete len:102 (-) Transcript_8872:45-350(-)
MHSKTRTPPPIRKSSNSSTNNRWVIPHTTDITKADLVCQFGDDDEVVCPPSPPPPRPRNPQSRLDPSNKRPRMADHRQTSDSSKGSDSDRERQEGGVDAPQ